MFSISIAPAFPRRRKASFRFWLRREFVRNGLLNNLLRCITVLATLLTYAAALMPFAFSVKPRPPNLMGSCSCLMASPDRESDFMIEQRHLWIILSNLFMLVFVMCGETVLIIYILS